MSKPFITATVMAHPKRKAQAERLAIELKKYSFMDVSITYDNNNDEWTTGERSLRRGIGRGEWHLVIQDDALLTPNFYENIEGAIAFVPDRVMISLYVGTSRPFPARVKAAVDKAYHATWLKHYLLFWGVGILIPSDHIEPMLEFCADPQYADTPYDARLGIFYQRNMLPVYYTMPSLVDHDDDLGTLIAGHGRDISPERRVAHRLATGPVRWNRHSIDI